MQTIIRVAPLSQIVFGSNSHSWQVRHPATLNSLHRTPPMSGHSPSPSLAPPRSLRTRHIRQGAKNFCCAKLGPCRVFSFLLAFGLNLSGFRIARQAKGAGHEQTEVIMSNFELQEKAVKAATRFIERKGYELLETGWGYSGRPDCQRRGHPGLHQPHRHRVRRGRLRERQGLPQRPRDRCSVLARGQLVRRRNPGPLRHHRHVGRERRQGPPEALHQHLQLRGRVTDLHPGPAGGPGAPRGHPEGLFPRLPAVPMIRQLAASGTAPSPPVLSATSRTAARSAPPCAP